MSGKIERKFIKRVLALRSKKGVKITTKPSELPEEFKEKKNFRYEPDIVIMKNDKITHIIEVETDPVRKAMVGSALTCAYFIKKKLRGSKPRLYFAIGREGLKQLSDFKARKKIIKEFVGTIFQDVKIEEQDVILGQLKKDLGLLH